MSFVFGFVFILSLIGGGFLMLVLLISNPALAATFLPTWLMFLGVTFVVSIVSILIAYFAGIEIDNIKGIYYN